MCPVPGNAPDLRTLPDDDVRAALWRFAARDDLRQVVAAARAVARGPVARLVAAGGRHTHEWTPEKAGILRAFDAAGLNAVGVGAEHGGLIAGPRSLALALAAFELAWVDAGAALLHLANYLALASIHFKGTDAQRARYLAASAAPQPDTGEPWRGAFALTEPLPYVGVETVVMGGKARVAAWDDGQEPWLQIEKRGRFISGMDFADFVIAAVQSADDRIKGSFMVILERTDEGTFDRGAPARKLVDQLASTRDPVFNLRVPASRIIGGYRIDDGVLVPACAHGEVIDAVFRRTRVTVGVMTAAKLLSAVEPVIRYHRNRFRGADAVTPGTPRYEFGLQQREDVLHRLVDIWAMGEAAAALGFEAARLLDALEPLELEKQRLFASRAIHAGRAETKALAPAQADALAYLTELARPVEKRRQDRLAALEADPLVRFVQLDAVVSVFGPAVKLWNTGQGAAAMREAVSLMGGYGITEDCPGFLGYKWMDAQLEATYEGPEAVHRRTLSATMTNEVFLAQFRAWAADMRRLASDHPGSGACTLATAMQMWLWSLQHLQRATDADGQPLYQTARQGVTFPLADALCWILAARQQILDVIAFPAGASSIPALDGRVQGLASFLTDLCHIQVVRAAGEVSRICAELLFGYRRHPAWERDGCASCYVADELDDLDEMIPGLAASARFYSDVIEADGTHEFKAGPCARTDGLEPFLRMQAKLIGCLTGARLAKDRAADALTHVAIPDTAGYPL